MLPSAPYISVPTILPAMQAVSNVARGQTGSPRSMTDPHRDRSSQCPAPSGAEAAP